MGNSWSEGDIGDTFLTLFGNPTSSRVALRWKEESFMSLRTEFIRLASLPETTISQLASRFGISHTTTYEWLTRFEIDETLSDRSRRLRPFLCEPVLGSGVTLSGAKNRPRMFPGKQGILGRSGQLGSEWQVEIPGISGFPGVLAGMVR
jgi:hypothetical protein